MVFFRVAVVDGEVELSRQWLERRDAERSGALVALGREMDIAFAWLLAVADDQDELRQGGPPVRVAALLCHARAASPPTSGAATQPMPLRRR